MKKSKLLTIVGAIVAIISVIIIVVLTNTKESIIYNITFDTNGGTQVETQKVEKGNKVKKPTDPTKDGFLFIEWTYQDEIYDFSHKVTKDLNLIANWVEVKEEVTTFVVRFETNGGTTISNQIVEQGNKIEKPIDPIKDGYTYNGWYLNDEIYDFEKNVEEDVELIAKWERIKEINKKTTTNNKKDDEKNNNNANNNVSTNNGIDENNENEIVDIKVEIPTLTPGHGSGGKIIYTGFSIELEGYYAIKENMDNIDGWELYEKVGNTYNQLSGHDVETDIGETKIYVARAYAYNKENVKIYSGYSNEYKVDNSKVETPTLTPGHGSADDIFTYVGFSIGLEGHYATKENMDNIDGWELYEKVGNTYIKLNSHNVEVRNEETKIYVARAYAYNKENVKIYSGYSNEYILK